MAVSDGALAVEARGVVKAFGARPALDGVDLLVRTGSVHGLLGPNGAGKTTLLRMLFGMVKPDGGRISLLGRTGDAVGNRALDGVAGFVDSPRFYPYLTGYRSLEMLAAYDGRVTPAIINTALDDVGLAERAHERTSRYSLGMRQRLGIAAALLRRPQLLILDEPANGLDPAGARDMRQIIRTLAEGGLTVLLSSHVMADIEMLCDDVTILHRGSVAFAGPLAELRGRAPSPMSRLSTSDDGRAHRLATESVSVLAHPDGGLSVSAQRQDLDTYVIALGRSGIAVRSLAQEATPLEALFLALTDDDDGDVAPSSDRPTALAGSAS
jgi:ABC-2 type transport system ATP-binding protein